jgi:solute carrier family 25 (mitochondrial carnitine/acylcarnitine transporter), member 20/29
VKSFLAGGVGGVAAVLVGALSLSDSSSRTLQLNGFSAGHPFDLTKTRLQTAPAGTYTGAIDVIKKALVKDGATGYVADMLLLL